MPVLVGRHARVVRATLWGAVRQIMLMCGRGVVMLLRPGLTDISLIMVKTSGDTLRATEQWTHEPQRGTRPGNDS